MLPASNTTASECSCTNEKDSTKTQTRYKAATRNNANFCRATHTHSATYAVVRRPSVRLFHTVALVYAYATSRCLSTGCP